jgi:hypothetical protein
MVDKKLFNKVEKILKETNVRVSFYGDGLQFDFISPNPRYNSSLWIKDIKSQQDLRNKLIAYTQAYSVDFRTDWWLSSCVAKSYSPREEVYAEMVKQREAINFLIDELKIK